jgi:hypothetical protein
LTEKETNKLFTTILSIEHLLTDVTDGYVSAKDIVGRLDEINSTLCTLIPEPSITNPAKEN